MSIKIFLSDVDGVLTDGGMYYTESGDEFKKFNCYDGMGMKLLQEKGYKVGVITSEDKQINRNRARKLKLDFDFSPSSCFSYSPFSTFKISTITFSSSFFGNKPATICGCPSTGTNRMDGMLLIPKAADKSLSCSVSIL